MSEGKMIAEKKGAVGWMIFNNPAKLNAVSMEMWEDAAKILKDFEADDDIRVVIVRGAGSKAFVSGADISKFESERASQEAVDRYGEAVTGAYDGLYAFPKPTIAMINGYCIGGGSGLAICCDIRICSDTARFAVPAAKLGLGYAHNHIKKLSDLVGPSFAKEIFFTARQFNAEEAKTMGLVNRVISSSLLAAYVEDYAKRIAENAPLTIAQVKTAVGESLKDPERRDLPLCEAMVKRCFDSKDYIEGRTAFMEKRTPVFTGK